MSKLDYQVIIFKRFVIPKVFLNLNPNRLWFLGISVITFMAQARSILAICRLCELL
jgi:hypothetical protein